MTQKFQYTGLAEITHINTRKEGPEDDKQLAVDLKLKVIASASILAYFDDNLSDFFHTEQGVVRNIMIGAIPMLHELDDYRMESMGGTHFGVKLKKFLLEAKDSAQVVITFQASFKPSGDEVARMAEFLQNNIQIHLEPANGELDIT